MKTSCEDNFSCFHVFGSIRKNKSQKNYLWSMKNPIKNMAYYLEIVLY